MADSDIENPASENSTSPSDAATSTMQIAMKIVEIRITRVKVLERPGARDRYDLSIIADSTSAGLLRTPRSPDAAQRVALAKRCAAEPGPSFSPATGVPALRSGMKNTAARPGHVELRHRPDHLRHLVDDLADLVLG